MAGEADAFLLFILAFLFPPAAVAFVAGCGADLCLNILLTCLAYLPGCIHAFWLILKRAEANERFGPGNWTYTGMGEYYARGQVPPGVRAVPVPGQQPPQPQPQPQPPPAPTPATQYPAEKQPPPSQAPVQSGSVPAEEKSTGYPGPPPQPPASGQGGYVAPPASADQKQGESAAPPGGN